MSIKKLYKIFSGILLATCIFAVVFVATCDMTYIGERDVEITRTYLSIYNLPVSISKNSFSDVYAYNSAGIVAFCVDYDDIYIVKNKTTAIAYIPLVYYVEPEILIDDDGNEIEIPKEYYIDFTETGTFIVTFTAYGDLYSQIIKKYNDRTLVNFINGNGLLRLTDERGFFKAELTNYDDWFDYENINARYDYSLPVIKKGSRFELRGSIYEVTENTPTSIPPTNTSSVLYIYASNESGDLTFKSSLIAPQWDDSYKGYYNENNRALFKYVLIIDEPENKYFLKTNIDEPFYPFHNVYATCNNPAWAVQYLPIHAEQLGEHDLGEQTLTLNSGIYIFDVMGSGGGKSDDSNLHWANGITSVSYGGRGGRGADVVFLSETTTFKINTGSAGKDAWRESFYEKNIAIGGSGGGGGGSGSYVFIDVPGKMQYFLCAGGGGGGGGRSIVSFDSIGSGGGGGAGGSIGGGGGGGSGGFLFSTFAAQLQNLVNYTGYNYEVEFVSGYGGNGGGNGNYGDFGKGGNGRNTSLYTGENGKDGRTILTSNYVQLTSYYGAGQRGDLRRLGWYINNTGSPSFEIMFNSIFYNGGDGISGTGFTQGAIGGYGGNTACFYDQNTTWFFTSNPVTWQEAAGKGGKVQQLINPSSGYLSNSLPYTNAYRLDQVEFDDDSTHGEDGGNNRTQWRGDGAVSGQAGWVKIYKIY